MPDLIAATTSFLIDRVAPRLVGRKAMAQLGHNPELERQALEEIEARISRGRPGPDEWPPPKVTPPPGTGRSTPPTEPVPPELRPLTVRVKLPAARNSPERAGPTVAPGPSRR